MPEATHPKEALEDHVVRCAADLLEDIPCVLQDEAMQRIVIFFRGIDRVPPAEFSLATFDEFREKFMRVCEAMREDFCAPERSSRWN